MYDIEQLKMKDVHLKEQYNRLCAEKNTFRPELDEDMIAKISEFVEELMIAGPAVVRFREDFYWLSSSYRMWFYYLLDRGLSTDDLPPTIPVPSSPLISRTESPAISREPFRATGEAIYKVIRNKRATSFPNLESPISVLRSAGV